MSTRTRTCTVCGGRVHEYEELREVHGDDPYYFCSDEHREEFVRSPDIFL